MTDRQLIPGDIARCPGDPDAEHHCGTCARKLQAERDPEDRWYPFSYLGPVKRWCAGKIEVSEHA